MARLHAQDPDEKLDYGINYSGRLPEGDDIATSSWTVPAGITSSGPAYSGQTATVFLTGGVAGQDYVISNRSTSEGGRIVEDYIVLQVRSSS